MDVRNLLVGLLLLLICFAARPTSGADFLTAVGGTSAPMWQGGDSSGYEVPYHSLGGWAEQAQPVCGDCGLDATVCGGHVPFTTVTLDLLILNRSRADAQDILFDGVASPTLNVRDLDLGTDSDVRVGIVLYHEHGYDVEFSYMGVGGHSASATRIAPGGSYLFYGGVPLTPSATYTAEYSSKMYSGELNGRWRANSHLTLLGGCRIVDLQEAFDILSAPQTGVFSSVDNDLYGGQLGAEGLLWTNGYCRAVGTLKAGVYHNSVNVRAVATNGGGAPITVRAQSDSTAFVGEVTAGFVIPIWPGELRFGYQGLWLENIALAPDQSDSLSFFAPGNVDFGKAVYHGAYLGWEATW